MRRFGRANHTLSLSLLSLVGLGAVACGDAQDPNDPARDSAGQGSGSGDNTGGNNVSDSGGNAEKGSTDDGAAGEGEGAGSDEAPVGETSTGPDTFIPDPSAECPEFTNGTVTFSVDGASRKAEVWMSDVAKTQAGPLIFFWHGMGSSPQDARVFTPVLEQLKAEGGVLVAPYSDPGAGMFSWYLTTGNGKDHDLRLADEIVACAKEELAIDTHRIHTTGFSAGALQSVQLAGRRSGYIASVAVWSGGLVTDLPFQDPDNRFPAFLFHGGSSDVVTINFQQTTERFADDLNAAGHFALVCDHGGGHTVPAGTPANVWQFLQDHPYGVHESPYQAKLPAAFPNYCETWSD